MENYRGLEMSTKEILTADKVADLAAKLGYLLGFVQAFSIIAKDGRIVRGADPYLGDMMDALTAMSRDCSDAACQLNTLMRTRRNQTVEAAEFNIKTI